MQQSDILDFCLCENDCQVGHRKLYINVEDGGSVSRKAREFILGYENMESFYQAGCAVTLISLLVRMK